ncbi:MAG: SH3 domain-containing protein [Verrucomicrobia bacterium]|nr:SH3 domain-containing protein [Verrucomicrobiota bacterium]
MKCLCFFAAALCLSVAGAFAADEAVVKAARINVRGQPTTGSEIVTQLKQGEKITVMEEIVHPKPAKGEPAKWLRIALPSNTPVWVSTHFLTNGAVAVPRLNIRSGPGENFSVIGRVPKGTVVKELRRNGDWLEIEAPANSFAYIAADLVIRDAAAPAPAPPASVGQLATKSKSPGKAADKSGKQMAKATPKGPPITAPDTKPTIDSVEVKPIAAPPLALVPGVAAPKPVRPPDAVLAPTAAPVAALSAPKPEPVKVAPPAALTENVPPPLDPFASTGRYKIEPEPVRGVGAWFKGLFVRKPAAEKAKAGPAAVKPAVEEGPLPIRVVTREGIVSRSWNIQTPSDWSLQDAETGRVINYLWATSTNIPWATLKGRTVVVTGEEALDVRWPNTPVLKVETLKTVDE